MKLKTFNRVDVSVHTEYTIFDRNGRYQDSFRVDYTDTTKEGTARLLKLYDLMKRGADVEHVSVNSVTGLLDVSVRV